VNPHPDGADWHWLCRASQTWRTRPFKLFAPIFLALGDLNMLRFVLSAVALAGVLATAQPAVADRLAATPSDHAQAAAAATKQPAPPAPASSSSSDAPAPARAGLGKGIVPVGFGWG